MSQARVTLVRDHEGEWEGLYVDGTLIAQGHSLQDTDWAEAFHLIGATMHLADATIDDRCPEHLTAQDHQVTYENLYGRVKS